MVFIPVQDDNPLVSIRFPWVTLALIASNVAVFVFMFGSDIPENAFLSFALVPRELLDEGLFGSPTYKHAFNAIDVAERWTTFTYLFMHGNFLHLLGNMLFLWIFGDNVEDAMGHARFVVFYFACGIFAAVFHAVLLPGSEVPLIGASGAVSGVVMAYLLLHPKVMIWILLFRFIPMRLPAAVVLGCWVLIQIVMPFALPYMGGQGTQIAWWAHIGGIIAGGLLILVMRRPGVPLLRGTDAQ